MHDEGIRCGFPGLKVAAVLHDLGIIPADLRKQPAQLIGCDKLRILCDREGQFGVARRLHQIVFDIPAALCILADSLDSRLFARHGFILEFTVHRFPQSFKCKRGILTREFEPQIAPVVNHIADRHIHLIIGLYPLVKQTHFIELIRCIRQLAGFCIPELHFEIDRRINRFIILAELLGMRNNIQSAACGVTVGLFITANKECTVQILTDLHDHRRTDAVILLTICAAIAVIRKFRILSLRFSCFQLVGRAVNGIHDAFQILLRVNPPDAVFQIFRVRVFSRQLHRIPGTVVDLECGQLLFQILRRERAVLCCRFVNGKGNCVLFACLTQHIADVCVVKRRIRPRIDIGICLFTGFHRIKICGDLCHRRFRDHRNVFHRRSTDCGRFCGNQRESACKPRQRQTRRAEQGDPFCTFHKPYFLSEFGRHQPFYIITYPAAFCNI